MSGKISGQVWALDIPRNERDVLLALADHADDFGRGARPSIKYLAWKVGISVRETIRCLKWLRDPSRNILQVTAEPGFHKPTCYRIHTENAPKKPDFKPKGDSYSPHSFEDKSDTRSPIAEPEEEKGDNSVEKGDQIDEKGDQMPLKGDPSLSPEPLLNRFNKPLAEPLKACDPENPEEEKARSLLEIEFHITLGPVGEKRFAALWAEVPIYELHRKSIYGLLSQKKRRFDFADYETTVRRISQRYQAGMVIGASP